MVKPDEQKVERDIPLAPDDIVVAIDVEVGADFSSHSGKSGVVYYQFFDDGGAEIEPIGRVQTSPSYGWFVYAAFPSDARHAHIELDVPPGAASVRVGLVDWGAKVLQSLVSFSVDAISFRSVTDLTGVSAENPMRIEGMRLKFPVEGGSRCSLELSHVGRPDSESLLLLSFENNSGEVVLPTADSPVHPVHGPYIQLKEVANGESTKCSVVIPVEASTLVLTGRTWKGDGRSLTEAPALHADSLGTNKTVERDAWLASIDEESDILVLHTTASSIRPDNSLLLRSNRMAMGLAERGWKVLLVPFSGMDDGGAPYRIGENLLQLDASDLVGTLNVLLERTGRGRGVYVCSSRTDILAVAIQNRLQDHGWQTIYETRDDMEEFNRVGYSKWYRPALEFRFATQADRIVATSPRLAERISSITGRADVSLLPNAAPDDLIAMSAEMRTVENFEANRTESTVGYLGHLTASWFDWPNVLAAARRSPTVRFEIIGHGMPADVRLPSNMSYLGPMAHDAAIEKMRHWRVGLVPFIESRLTYGVDANKLYEYVALGLQTVSAPMGDLENVPGVHVYRLQDELVSAIETAVSVEPSKDFYDACEQFSAVSGWSVRVEQFAQYLEEITR